MKMEQHSHSLILINIEETMQWLSLPMHTGSYVIAHCGGSSDHER